MPERYRLPDDDEYRKSPPARGRPVDLPPDTPTVPRYDPYVPPPGLRWNNFISDILSLYAAVLIVAAFFHWNLALVAMWAAWPVVSLFFIVQRCAVAWEPTPDWFGYMDIRRRLVGIYGWIGFFSQYVMLFLGPVVGIRLLFRLYIRWVSGVQ